MWRRSFSIVELIEAFLDPSITIGLLFLIVFFNSGTLTPPYVILMLIIFSLTFPGKSYLNELSPQMIRRTLWSWVFLAGLLLTFGYGSGYIYYFPKTVIFVWMIACPIVLVGAKLICRALLPKFMAIEGNHRRAVVIGCNEIGLKLAQNFHENVFIGLQFVGFFDDRSRDRLTNIGDKPLLGNMNEVASYVNRNRIDHIYLTLPMASQPRILKLLEDLKDTTVSVFFVPDIFVTDLIQGRMDDILGIPVVAVCETPFNGFNGIVKRASDIFLASSILFFIAPIMIAIAIAIKTTSPGPIIFRQRRYGLDGKEIMVYKFRSMTVTDNGDVVRQATRNDARITPVGKFLRRTSLDELPQFINVLQGRMSIVGPRPHAVAHNEEYRKLIKGYMVRHKVKPGITGWAQVNGYRGETETIDKMEKRIQYDLEYLRTWSLTFDLWILIKTVIVVTKDENAY